MTALLHKYIIYLRSSSFLMFLCDIEVFDTIYLSSGDCNLQPTMLPPPQCYSLLGKKSGMELNVVKFGLMSFKPGTGVLLST